MSSYYTAGTSEISRDAPNVCDAKERLSSPGKTDVSRDGSIELAAALFKESMRCVAMIGTTMWFILMGYRLPSITQR